ncbi:MAG: ABC transporter permease [Ardenticatenaceae bacterium]|nr:ABC transporter permease [Ardenticatenaceae bacterium]MCB8988419.1 ABC transporter permease [Ardenticatenaceae bacterium]
MATSKFFAIAFRNLARNGRRTFLTALAVALGLVVVMAMSSLIEGMVSTMVADSIRISTGHVQVRNINYDVDNISLLSQDLLQNPEAWKTQAEALPEVQSAAPVLWSGGLLSTPGESVGIQIVGIDPDDAFFQPVRQGIVAGQFLQTDDRGQILVGKMLADQMEITVGQRVSLAASNANGEGQEGVFIVAGLVDTGFPSIDQHRVILPLAQAQSFSGVGNRFSSLILTLHDEADAPQVAALFASPDTQALTWEDLNSLILSSVKNGLIFYYVLYGIVFLAVAVLIANTLLMSVFARAREIGILASLGMNRRQITGLFLVEGILLALLGIAIGLVLGLGVVAYMTYVGISVPAETAAMVEGFTMGTTIKGGFAPVQFVVLSLLLLVIVSLVSLYPASYAARMEPVEALHHAL